MDKFDKLTDIRPQCLEHDKLTHNLRNPTHLHLTWQTCNAQNVSVITAN